MNFTVSRDNFYKVLQKVINIIPSKSTVDILYNVLIISEENQLKVIATDLEITQIAWIPCETSSEVSVTVPGKLLLDIIREMPSIDLNFAVDENYRILITSDLGEYKLSGQSKTEYPSVPLVESDQKITLQNNILKRMIEKTVFACSTDNLRPALTGVFCQIMENEYRMVSTDGHRLVRMIYNSFENTGFVKDIIVPTKALTFVARNLPEEGKQNIIISENHILFELPGTKIYSRLIKDPYPDYERVIPADYSKEILIDKNQFISSVKRVSLFSNTMTYQVKLEVEANKMGIHAQDIDFGGEASETIPCNFGGEAMVVAYNAIYLMDLLRHMDSEKIHFKLEDADGPGIILPDKQDENEDLLMLIMPVRLNN